MKYEMIGAIRAGHPKIVVVIPYRVGSKDLAKKAAEIHHSRAGMDCEVYIVPDINKEGWVAMQNKVFSSIDFDYYIYSCDDYFPGRDYIRLAYTALIKQKVGVMAFNDGKWEGHMATAALVDKKFIITIYGGDLFYKGYKQNYADPELTDIAMDQNMYGYEPNAVLMEIDYEKDAKYTNPFDRKIYLNREGFNKRFG